MRQFLPPTATVGLPLRAQQTTRTQNNNLGAYIDTAAGIPRPSSTELKALWRPEPNALKTLRESEVTVLKALGELNALSGEHSKAVKRYEDLPEIKRNTGDVKGEAETLNDLGDQHQKQGVYSESHV